jgi:prepilin-type N-terminal cleavage/methylation domain-containing protein
MTRGFTLIEVVVALVLLEIGVLGVVGTLLLATRTLTEAELTTRAAARAALVADSLETHGFVGPGADSFPWGVVRWADAAGAGPAVVVATDALGDTLARLAVTGSSP